MDKWQEKPRFVTALEMTKKPTTEREEGALDFGAEPHSERS
jgi:hypothetical protein